MARWSFTFDSDLMGWLDNSPVGATIGHNSSDGQSRDGCLQLSLGSTTTLSTQKTVASVTTIATGDVFKIWYRVLAETGQTLFRDLILSGGGSPAGTVWSDSIVIPGGDDTGWDLITVDLSGEVGNTFNIIRTSFQVGGVVPFVFRLDDVLFANPFQVTHNQTGIPGVIIT